MVHICPDNHDTLVIYMNLFRRYEKLVHIASFPNCLPQVSYTLYCLCILSASLYTDSYPILQDPQPSCALFCAVTLTHSP